jgi:superfamily I DNA and/or RNA helicase
MHPTIGTLISKVFYEDEIQNGIPAENRNIGISKYDNVAIEWISTSSRPEKDRYEIRVGHKPYYTYKNNLEIGLIKGKLIELDESAHGKMQVAVITAYSAQKYAISNMIKQHKFKKLSIEVDTVDAFQGSQKEIIIYSTVRSNKNTMIGFLKSEARLNVAFSRAKSLLIIVGDHKFLNNIRIRNNRFPEIIDYIKSTEGCVIKEV